MFQILTRETIIVFALPDDVSRIAGQLMTSLLLLLATTAEATSQSDGLTLFFRADYAYDSNVFRLTDSAEALALLGSSGLSDNILQTGGGLGFRMPVSQQELTLDVEAYYNKYDRFDFLDHTSSSASANWRWSYGTRWEGNVRAKFEQDMQGFEESGITEKDIRDQWHFLFNGDYAVSPRWKLYLAAARNYQLHDLSSRQMLDRKVDHGVLEIRYKTPRESYLGYKTVVRSAELPHRNLVEAAQVNNSYLEYENSLTVNWVLSAHSGFNGRLGHTNREYDSFSQRDFSGLTWQLEYQWRPRSRYELNASVWRDLDAYSEMVSSYVIETGGSLQGVWAMTPQLSLRGDFFRKTRSYDGDPQLSPVTVPSRRDWLVSYGISAEYALREQLKVNLGYLVEERESNMDEWEYDYGKLMLGVEASF